MPNKQTNRIQAKAIQILNPNGELWEELKIIALFGAEWCDIIKDYKEQHGRLPEGKDLIFITGVHHKQDPRKMI